jgi:hypothetical protein
VVPQVVVRVADDLRRVDRFLDAAGEPVGLAWIHAGGLVVLAVDVPPTPPVSAVGSGGGVAGAATDVRRSVATTASCGPLQSSASW